MCRGLSGMSGWWFSVPSPDPGFVDACDKQVTIPCPQNDEDAEGFRGGAPRQVTFQAARRHDHGRRAWIHIGRGHGGRRESSALPGPIATLRIRVDLFLEYRRLAPRRCD